MAIRIGGVINTGCCSFRSRNVRNSASRIARLPPRRCRRRRVRLSIMVSVSSRISYTSLTRKFFAKAKQKYIFYLFFCDNKSLFLCTIGTFLGYTTFTKRNFRAIFRAISRKSSFPVGGSPLWCPPGWPPRWPRRRDPCRTVAVAIMNAVYC